MSNLFDYLEWRGDLTFSSDPLNEVDSLLFSQIAYLDLKGIIHMEQEKHPYTLEETMVILQKKKSQLENDPICAPFSGAVFDLILKASKTERFRNAKLSFYADEIDTDLSSQFAGVIITYDKHKHFVAFRGTDDTLTGWKEDFFMCFKDEIPSQRKSVQYLAHVSSKLKGILFLGGHSKGGNLAVYAASHNQRQIQKRIQAIYNFDGPGFQSNVIQRPSYQAMIHKMITYVPKSSIVGLLLEHGESYKVINSSAIKLKQHDPLSWQLKGCHFEYEEELTDYSKCLDKALRSWLETLNYSERETFVSALFEILQETGAQTLTDLTKEKLKLLDTTIKTYKNMSPDTRLLLRKTISVFLKERQRVLRTFSERK